MPIIISYETYSRMKILSFNYLPFLLKEPLYGCICFSFYQYLIGNLRNIILKQGGRYVLCKKWPYVVKPIASRTFLSVTKCHLTQILLIAAKQCWFNFEGNECIFHLSLIFFCFFHQLTRNQQNRAFPNLWLTLYITNFHYFSLFMK